MQKQIANSYLLLIFVSHCHFKCSKKKCNDSWNFYFKTNILPAVVLLLLFFFWQCFVLIFTEIDFFKKRPLFLLILNPPLPFWLFGCEDPQRVMLTSKLIPIYNFFIWPRCYITPLRQHDLCRVYSATSVSFLAPLLPSFPFSLALLFFDFQRVFSFYCFHLHIN